MKTDTTKATAEAAEGTLFLGDDWFDPLESGVRTRIRGFIEELRPRLGSPTVESQGDSQFFVTSACVFRRAISL